MHGAAGRAWHDVVGMMLPLKDLDGLLDAAVSFRGGSLPELFCGFHREPHLGPDDQ